MDAVGVTPFLPLFVPANRPERIAKAARSGADAVVVDLEDAVAADGKEAARRALREALGDDGMDRTGWAPVLVRINGADSAHFQGDLDALRALTVDGAMLPKTEAGGALAAVRQALPQGAALIALIETARGLADARELAQAADRLAFGSIDFAGALGAAHGREALLHARSEIVLAAALAGAPAPLDGVTAVIDEAETIEADARYAASLGFRGKLLIHPHQIAPALRGFAPEEAAVERAHRLLESADGDAARFEGAMIDRPVIEAARQTVESGERIARRLAQMQERT